jgi:phage virion morphogenesis protein
MTNRLETLEDWAAGLLGQLEPASRNKLTRNIGHALRRSQQKRITVQQNPDGSKYPPRKYRRLRGKEGRVKRKLKMFQTLRTAKLLKLHCDVNTICIGLTGRTARIGKVHQFGLKDRTTRKAPLTQYRTRQLLGLTKIEQNLIRDKLLGSLLAT